MRKPNYIFAIFAVIVLLAAALQPAIARPAETTLLLDSKPESSSITPATASALSALGQMRAAANQQRKSGLDVDALQAATPPENQTDTDGDSLYDSVEWVLGTDFNNSDSDFDRLNDSEEVMIYFTDPLEPDSNNDGLADYFEVINVSSLDLDGDGYPNAWDFDNDGDGVVDTLDLSPFSRSITSDRFHFDIKTNGSPSYLSFQLRPQDPNHLRLPVQTWDWPFDDEGAMKDVNRSTDDVSITPVLELTVPVYCKIVANHSSKYLEVQANSTADGANVRQYNDTGLDSQIWKLDPIGDGYYKLIAKHSGKCLEVFNASLDDGANVRQNSDTGLDNQLWKLDPVGGGYYKLVAKHSRKCLEVSSNSIADGANVQQYEYWDRNNQQWKFELVENVLPPQGDIEDYGITVSLNKLFIPLSSSTDYGSPVALSGRMFFPASVPLNLSADAQLVWMVTGKTDRTGKKIALKQDNLYVSAGYTASYTASAPLFFHTVSGDSETFELIKINDSHVAFKAHNGRYVGIKQYVETFPPYTSYDYLVADSETIGPCETFALEYLPNNKVQLKAYNGKYVRMGVIPFVFFTPLTVEDFNSDFSELYQFDLITIAEAETERTVLARYKENFSLTGFRVEENYGSDAGLFYSDDMNQTLNAGFVMAFQFLRNATTQISDMPTELDTYNVTGMKSTFGSFSHRDEALLNVTSVMKLAVLDELDNLTDDQALPVILAFEDNFTSLTMDELVSESYLTGANFTVDLTDVPVATEKGLKMGWYNLTTNESVEIDTVLTEIYAWGQTNGLDNDTLATMMSVILAWRVGESTVTRIGSVATTFDVPEVESVLELIKTSGIANIGDVLQIVKNSGTYKSISYTWMSVQGIKTAFKGVLKINKLVNKFKALNAIKKGLKTARATIVFILIEAAVVTVLALYTSIELALNGYSEAAAIAFFYQVGMFLLEPLALSLVSSTLWFLSGFFGNPLAIITVVWEILDAIFGWTGDWMQDVIDWFSSEWDSYLVIPGAWMEETTLNIDDYDDNGLDVGDRVELKSRAIGKIGLTGESLVSYPWVDICSWIDLTYSYSVPPGSGSNGSIYRPDPPGPVVDLSSWIIHYVEPLHFPYEKVRAYEIGMWAEPSKGMKNFPVTFQLVTAYLYNYLHCENDFGVTDCERKPYFSVSVSDPTTIYFDVFPGTIDDFVNWRVMSALDYDGDGRLNTEEITTSQWKFDTDGDGLSDTFELKSGTSPTNTDTDGDGLSDGIELHLGTDPLKKDTDGDVLNDFEEHRGWQVNFTYYDQQFTENVSSDPHVSDSDGDGLTDLEECMKRLNPRSKDTDGNGTGDANESIVPSSGCIRGVDFNGKGGSLMIQPNATITATVDYRLVGVLNATGQPANCSIVVTLDNSTVQHEIYNGTPDVGNVTEGSAAFSFTAPATGGIYNLRYYWNWSVSGNGSAATERGAIGVIIVSSSGSMEWVTSGPDNDHDMLIDLNELIGWDVNFTDANGSHTIHVTSDSSQKDTDSDGLTDGDEYSDGHNSTNPRDVDTDDDGLWDEVELKIGTNPISYDTDGDGIDDSTEITFGSHPNNPDPDGDNLNDSMEFELESDPWNPDTDGDGLRDGDEWACGSSVLQPDPDADTLFDNLECELGSDPWNPDTDDDGLNDGYEYFIFESSPIHNDTDFDLLLDGDELFWGTDPVCNDTDDDGLNDSRELYLGTNPLFEDTDYDAINDSEDMDSYAPHVDPIILAYDCPDADTDEFMMNLKRYTNVTNVSAAELLVNYTDAPYIVLVGRPDGNDTVGNITATLLNDSQDILTQMIESDYDRFEVKYGVWNSTQTVVMLSHPYPSDHWRVLTMLKSKTETVLPDSIEVKWPTPRDLFGVDTENTLKQTDSLIWVALEHAVTPWVKMSRYNADTTPIALTRTSGLGYDEAVGRYLEIEVSENVQNETGDVIERALIRIYYTTSDLDRTGDGDANDAIDINESKLKLYQFDESSGHWIALSKDMDWVCGTGVDTTNVELYGTRYEGYVWANVSHFSLFGIASEGRAHGGGGGTTPTDSDNDGLSDLDEILKGTDPYNPDTDGDGVIDSLDTYPLDPTRPVQLVVTPSPSVTPTVTPPITPTPVPTPTEVPATPTPEEPGFEGLMWLLAVAFVALTGYVNTLRRRE